MKIEWADHRNSEGYINLETAMCDFVGVQFVSDLPEDVLGYLLRVELLRRINSRQVAAVVLVNAQLLMLPGGAK